MNHRSVAIASALVLACLPRPAAAQCPVGTRITIDHDIPGSGYSETSSNWTTWNTAPCNGSGYRYLSHTVGDGTRKGKAIWTPAVPVAGHYRVETGYRATSNRTTDADYRAYDDLGAVVYEVVDQTQGSDCVWVDLGTSYCVPGGQCRVELDGTDDSQSDCADVTVYELIDCQDAGAGGAAGASGRCDAIRANPAWEVCLETATTCAGVFTDGAGCVAYCAAAGMTCTARFGGEPGCQKESQNELSCGDDNGHASDWCECEGPPVEPDAGVSGAGGGTAGGGGAAGAAGQGGVSSGGAEAGLWVDASSGGTSAGGTAGSPQWPSGGSSGTSGKPPDGTASGSDDGGCGCRVAGGSGAGAFIALAFLMGAGRRRRW